jgi:hypothetical protein
VAPDLRLAAVGVALSTRFSLVVNLPTVILLYIAGNLTRFLFPADHGPLAQRSPVVKGFAYLISLVLPYLETFDLRKTSTPRLAGQYVLCIENDAVSSRHLGYTGIRVQYAIASAFALAGRHVAVPNKREPGWGGRVVLSQRGIRPTRAAASLSNQDALSAKRCSCLAPSASWPRLRPLAATLATGTIRLGPSTSQKRMFPGSRQLIQLDFAIIALPAFRDASER